MHGGCTHDAWAVTGLLPAPTSVTDTRPANDAIGHIDGLLHLSDRVRDHSTGRRVIRRLTGTSARKGTAMDIACVTSTERGGTDRLLSEMAARLQGEGLSLAGIVKETEYTSNFENGCDMKVRVLPQGPVVKITQDLGAGSDACRLDPGAIADAVSHVEAGPIDKADLFILNKFGPEEAAGRGFVSAIGRALDEGVPVLVGVGASGRNAFDTFAGGLAQTLPDNAKAIHDWCETAIKRAREHPPQ